MLAQTAKQLAPVRRDIAPLRVAALPTGARKDAKAHTLRTKSCINILKQDG